MTKDVVESIKNNWERIKKAIIATKNFLKNHNIYNDAILSYNAVLPIVYYYYYADSNLKKSIQNESILTDDLDDDPDAVNSIDPDGMPVKFNNTPVELDPFAVKLFFRHLLPKSYLHHSHYAS